MLPIVNSCIHVKTSISEEKSFRENTLEDVSNVQSKFPGCFYFTNFFQQEEIAGIRVFKTLLQIDQVHREVEIQHCQKYCTRYCFGKNNKN